MHKKSLAIILIIIFLPAFASADETPPDHPPVMPGGPEKIYKTDEHADVIETDSRGNILNVYEGEAAVIMESQASGGSSTAEVRPKAVLPGNSPTAGNEAKGDPAGNDPIILGALALNFFLTLGLFLFLIRRMDKKI